MTDGTRSNVVYFGSALFLKLILVMTVIGTATEATNSPPEFAQIDDYDAMLDYVDVGERKRSWQSLHGSWGKRQHYLPNTADYYPTYQSDTYYEGAPLVSASVAAMNGPGELAERSYPGGVLPSSSGKQPKYLVVYADNPAYTAGSSGVAFDAAAISDDGDVDDDDDDNANDVGHDDDYYDGDDEEDIDDVNHSYDYYDEDIALLGDDLDENNSNNNQNNRISRYPFKNWYTRSSRDEKRRPIVWNKVRDAWGKREPGWNKLKGVWGKRASGNWKKLHAAWGKRTEME